MISHRYLTSLLLTLSVLISHTTLIHAHGMMCAPRQRAAYKSSKCGDMPNFDQVMKDAGATDAELNNVDYCAHCLNGGGAGTVKTHLGPDGWTLYEPIKNFDGSATRTGICGDAVGKTDHMIGGSFMRYKNVPIVEKWKQGSTVDFAVEIDTNHNGYFEYFLCNLDTCGTTDLDGKCFKDGHCVKLNRVPHPDCEDASVDTHQECGPIDEKYPGRFYLPCRKGGHVGVHVVGGEKGTMRYQLPSDFKCNHCVLQWYYVTANSCSPRGFNDYFTTHNNPFGTTCPSDGGGLGAHREDASECGGAKQPEEFWTCADVQITSDGKSAGPIESVPSTDASSTDVPSTDSTSMTPIDSTTTPMESVPPTDSVSSTSSSPEPNLSTPIETESPTYEPMPTNTDSYMDMGMDSTSNAYNN